MAVCLYTKLQAASVAVCLLSVCLAWALHRGMRLLLVSTCVCSHVSVHACMCVFVDKKEREQWRPNNEHDHWAPVSAELLSRLWSHGDQPPWCRAQTIYAWSEFLVWSPHLDRYCLCCALTVTRYCMVTVWQAFLVKIYFVSIIAKFLGEDLSRHEQSMFKRCFTSHLSCLFESDLTSRAQGHAADLSLCFCVWTSTPTSSVSVKFIFLFPSAELLLIPFTSSATPLLLIDCTHSPGPRGQVKDIIKKVFEQISNAPPSPFTPWLCCSLCLCQSDIIIITH